MRRTLLALTLTTLLTASSALAEDATLRKLRQNLRAMDPALRTQALTSLTYDRPKTLSPELIQLVLDSLQKDPADSVKEAAQMALLQWLESGLPAETRKLLVPSFEKALEGPSPLPASMALLLFLEGDTKLTQAQLLKSPLEVLASDEPYQALELLARCSMIDVRVSKALLAEWQKDPSREALLKILVEVAPLQPLVARGIEKTLLEQTLSKDLDKATNAWGYFARPQLAEPVRTQLLENLKTTEGELRLTACRSLLRGLKEPAPLIDWVRSRLGSKDPEERSRAALVLLEDRELREPLRAEHQKVLSQPGFGEQVLQELIRSGRLPGNRFKELGARIRTAPELDALYSLSRLPGAAALIPDIAARLKSEKQPANQLMLCQALQSLGEMTAPLSKLKQLVLSSDPEVSRGALSALSENPLMNSRELAGLASRLKQCGSLAMTLERRPSLAWKDQLALLQQALKEGPESHSAVYLALSGKEQWPGSRALLEKLFSVAPADLKLSVGQSLFSNYRDQRVFEPGLKMLAGDTLPSAISVYSMMVDELNPQDKARLRQALKQALPESTGYTAAALVELLWRCGQEPRDVLPLLLDPGVLEMVSLEEMPLEQIAAALTPDDVVALGQALETFQGNAPMESSKTRTFQSLARLFVLAYPKTQSLTPVMGSIKESPLPVLARLARSALEQVAP